MSCRTVIVFFSHVMTLKVLLERFVQLKLLNGCYGEEHKQSGVHRYEPSQLTLYAGTRKISL